MQFEPQCKTVADNPDSTIDMQRMRMEQMHHMLAAYPDKQPEAIIMHYAAHADMVRIAASMLNLAAYQNGGILSPEQREYIAYVTSVLAKNHARDLGLALERKP